jgi:DNA-binding response OmpR family regulator
MGTAARTAKTVLVVDDDPTIGELIATVLSDVGFRAVVVQDGHDVLSAAHALEPDAITLDLDLPGLDGRSILQCLRADARTRAVPIVVVSAATETLPKEEEQLADSTLAKPFEVLDLIEVVSASVDSQVAAPA